MPGPNKRIADAQRISLAKLCGFNCTSPEGTIDELATYQCSGVTLARFAEACERVGVQVGEVLRSIESL